VAFRNGEHASLDARLDDQRVQAFLRTYSGQNPRPKFTDGPVTIAVADFAGGRGMGQTGTGCVSRVRCGPDHLGGTARPSLLDRRVTGFA
jgi:hypothetical protein